MRLYAGLGAYRIGAGDGSDTGTEWYTGHALADQLAALDCVRACRGAALYRYGSLFDNADAPGLSAAEVEGVKKAWG